MNMKSIPVAVTLTLLLCAGIAGPILLYQQQRIAELESRLISAQPPPAKFPKPARNAPAAVAAKAAARNLNRRQQALADQEARLAPVKDRLVAWDAALIQVDDAGKKQRALDEILAALSSSDPKEIFAGLTAYGGAGQVEFDRAPFRPAMVSLLGHGDPMLRRMALDRIAGLPADPGDVDLVRAMASDPEDEVRRGIPASLFWLTKGELNSAAGQSVLEVLNRAEHPDRDLIDTMWGAKMSPELERKLVGYARSPSQPEDGQLNYYAVYSCLSTQQNKGPDCVDLLIERLSDADSYNVGGRAAWGLAYGVQPGLGLEKKIADAAIKVWQNRTDGYLKENLMKCLQQYGDASHAAVLENQASAPAMGPQQRQQLLDVAAQLQAKSAPAAVSAPEAGQ